MRINAPSPAAILSMLVLGCAQTPRTEADPVVAATSTGGEESSGEADGDGGDSDTGTVILDVPAVGTGIGGEQEECASFSAMANLEKRPADILWVVDNSPSMVEEAAAVRARLGDFSAQIVEAGIDARVFLLTSFPNTALPPSIDTGVCIEPPLGGGGCPLADNNPPHFGHVQALIGSNAALPELIDSHDLWAPMIRDGSSVHIIVVSDDDSGMDAATFDEAFRALDPRLADYQLHGIVSLQQCAAADTIGSTYIELAEQTDGILGDLCDQQFQPLFDLLSTAVTQGTGLDCAWSLPEPPMGLAIDPDSVEVLYDEGGEDSVVLSAVANAAACEGVDNGWYYDDAEAPSEVLACPQTCAQLQQAEGASIRIDVGCAHKPVG